MSTIDSLLEKKKQYYNLLDKVEITKKNIDDSIKHIELSIDSFQKSYIVEDKKADNNILETVETNCIAISERLSQNIENINREIHNLDIRIEEYYAALAAAAAAAAKAQEKGNNDSGGNSNSNGNNNTPGKSSPNNRNNRAKLRDDDLEW